MKYNGGNFDIIVIGAGHAGCEAALCCSRLGFNTLLLTMSNDSIAYMACNPAIGGSSKGHLVREIDALGGEMGKCADATFLQIKQLNTAKGPAVHSLRAQIDKQAYSRRMKWTLENNVYLRQAEATSILVENGKACGVVTSLGAILRCKAVVMATGVYLKGKIYIGEHNYASGPAGLFGANSLSQCLLDLGMKLRRFKTGTPARIDRRSIDFSKFEVELGDVSGLHFSFNPLEVSNKNVPCYLGYTNQQTHEIIRANMHRSPLFSGEIEGVGPRYCPSIEDKVKRFADKERHQFFIEPEGEHTNEMYIQGMSSSLPEEVQIELYRSIVGLSNARFTRTAYAIEYDCIDPTTLQLSLESKDVSGLFFAGQINGTSGYEEAAAQGLIAGINACNYLNDNPPLIIGRNQGYTGVLIDDLVTKGTNEPYRMMTARAEYRLLLRQDNADYRLTEYGRTVGLIDDTAYRAYVQKYEAIDRGIEKLKTTSMEGIRLSEWLKRPEIKLEALMDRLDMDLSPSEKKEIEARIKYEGYILKQQKQVEKFLSLEEKPLDDTIDYMAISGLRLEARQKLHAVKPKSVGQASRISGVSPSDIAVLLVYLEKQHV